MLLLKVQAGSHLYGYSTPESDIDFFEIHTDTFPNPNIKRAPLQAEQTIVDGVDVTRMTLKRFVEKAQKGAHQALDAMFAREPIVDFLGGYRASYRAGLEVISTYQHAIIQFATRDEGAFRYQRHAYRLMMNINEIVYTGRYTPELSFSQIEKLNKTAALTPTLFKEKLISDSLIQLPFMS